jgi:hypothetical protein
MLDSPSQALDLIACVRPTGVGGGDVVRLGHSSHPDSIPNNA